MFNLLILLTERLGLIMILAFLLVNMRFFRNLIKQRTKKSQIWLTIIFSLFVILANLTGVEITNSHEVFMPALITSLTQADSIANTRTLVITTASLTAGPYVGMIVGLVGGLHRVFFSNFSDYFYIFSSIIIGLVIGKISDHVKQGNLYPSNGWVILLGITADLIQMGFIDLFRGFALVRLIFWPMVILNTIGTFLFVEILKTYMSNEQQLRAVQTKDVLELANKTLPYFRQGLDMDSAHHVCKIIKNYTNFDAVGLTDQVNVLAHVGAGSDHHIAGEPILTDLSKSVITTGQRRIVYSATAIGCPQPHCPLAAAMVVPLEVNHQTMGALKVYFTDARKLTVVEENLVTGLQNIFSGQLAMGLAEEQASLVTEAQIKELQVQINPHFFFNAINTILALIRINPDKARHALMQLSIFFRSSLQNGQATQITLQAEKQHVDAYMDIEELRFPNRFILTYDLQINDQVLVPSFCLQIFVENAIKHAFKKTTQPGHIKISARPVADNQVQIQVQDDGCGMDAQLCQQLGQQPINETNGTGTALYNLNCRLRNLYGNQSTLQVQSNSAGSTFTIVCPIQIVKEAQPYADSHRG